jgi:hypothetical protein
VWCASVAVVVEWKVLPQCGVVKECDEDGMCRECTDQMHIPHAHQTQPVRRLLHPQPETRSSTTINNHSLDAQCRQSGSNNAHTPNSFDIPTTVGAISMRVLSMEGIRSSIRSIPFFPIMFECGRIEVSRLQRSIVLFWDTVPHTYHQRFPCSAGVVGTAAE